MTIFEPSLEFTIHEQCHRCGVGDNTEKCKLTGFVEKVRCTKSQKVEVRVCEELPEGKFSKNLLAY